ncbi:amidase-like protein [Nemania abortiva]|nr:amidase-like protein [Nemania abortiva]
MAIHYLDVNSASIQKNLNLTRTTSVIELGDKAFTIQGKCDYEVRLTDSPHLDTLTCFVLPRKSNLRDQLEEACLYYRQNDDVFCNNFLTHVLLISDESPVDDSALDLIKSWGCLTIFHLPVAENTPPPGPYFFSACGLYSAWRIFPDDKDAFILSTIPTQDDPHIYQNLNAAAFGASSLCVAVPSRLKTAKSEQQPLAGMRIGIKDLFHLKGVHTGCGNRAYRALHEASSTSSSAVESVLSLGGIIVGKTKTVEFGCSQEVIGDWCDYSYPFNARGDGYIAATGSSTGSASSLAAYPWLDITLGTDGEVKPETTASVIETNVSVPRSAGGSIRDPAVAHGIYGFRPSHDGQQIPDVVIPCGIFHTTGFLGRSSGTMLEFGRHWLQPPSNNDVSYDLDKNKLDALRLCQYLKPKRVLFPKEYYSDHEGVQKLAEEWVSSLTTWLGAGKLDVSIEETWSTTKPTSARKGFFETFNRTFIDLTYSEFWSYLSDFRKAYKEKFDAEPYVCRVTQYIWEKGRAMSDARKQEALNEVSTHNDWFLRHLLVDDQTIIVVPRYKLDYRDEYLPAPEFRSFEGFDSNYHASFSGIPNIIVPVGQCTYHSKISGKEEQFPVSVSIFAPKGKDIGLLSLVHDYLTANALPASVRTGPTAFGHA